jgi:hypothetical protein
MFAHRGTPRRHAKRSRFTAATAATALATTGIIAGLTATGATNANATTNDLFVEHMTPGVYTVTIPDDTTDFTLDLAGGNGAPGQSDGTWGNVAGSAGRGAVVSAGISTLIGDPDYYPGEQLTVVVGGYATGNPGGSGSLNGGAGGAGGGASYILSPTGKVLAIAGGGGGGGGAGAGAQDDRGGSGGYTNFPGGDGYNTFGNAGSGGGVGNSNDCPANTMIQAGRPGTDAPNSSSAGGGGGGGGG